MVFLGIVFAQAPIIDYPEFETFTMPNGLKVMIAEHHENPAVFMNMMIEVGSMDVAVGDRKSVV